MQESIIIITVAVIVILTVIIVCYPSSSLFGAAVIVIVVHGRHRRLSSEFEPLPARNSIFVTMKRPLASKYPSTRTVRPLLGFP
jgi:hypothetical protein